MKGCEMFKGKLLVLLLVLCVALPCCSGSGTQGRIGQWRVEVGPPGNEFYEAEQPVAQTPPSEAVLRWAKILAPSAKLKKWELKSKGYEIETEMGDEEYKFTVTPGGELLKLKYENDATYVKEEPNELVLRGTKKSIALSAVPKATLKTLAKAMPDAKPSKVWSADTIVGPRYVIQVGKMAFYARPDGQIQAGDLVSKGALDEVDPAKAEVVLAQYRQHFNFENQIKRLGRWPKSADGSYRYVVMGDSRSQWELWSNIVKHIDSLDPKPDFVINGGDIVHTGYSWEYSEYYIPPVLETDIPFFVAIGNHDDGTDSMAQKYRYLFGQKSLNYYFDYGNARYVFIDNVTKVQPSHHAWDDPISHSQAFTDLMTKHEVDEVYLGHIHAYSTAHYNGVDYTLTGGGGAPLKKLYGPLGNVHHYIICDVMWDGTVKQQVVRFYKDSK